MKLIRSEDHGKDLCERLGLDPSTVTGITIRFQPGEATYVDVEILATEEIIGEFVTGLTTMTYQIVPDGYPSVSADDA